MRYTTILISALAVLILISGSAAGEVAASDSITYESWDWDNETVNTFTGSVDLSEWNGTELTIELSAAFQPESDAASEKTPKFTHVNGKRLTMLAQGPVVTYTPEAGQKAFEFSGSLQMPEKDHFQRITIDLKAADPEGNEVKKISVSVAMEGNNPTQTGSIFYIPFDIRTAAAVIATAAAVIWILAVIMNRVTNRRK